MNFVAAHDGFTIADLTMFNTKHNADNGEGNRDGTTDNRSWNHGTEGPSNDPASRPNGSGRCGTSSAFLLLATGVLMINAGDEFGRTAGATTTPTARTTTSPGSPGTFSPGRTTCSRRRVI